jgi:hypothetical protein
MIVTAAMNNFMSVSAKWLDCLVIPYILKIHARDESDMHTVTSIN